MKLIRCNAFIVPSGIEKKFLAGSDHPLYGNGPDPIDHIDKNHDPIEQQLLNLCLLTRKKISTFLKNKCLKPVETDWTKYLSSDALSGYCGFVSACLHYFVKKIPELKDTANLIHHQVATIFPNDEGGRHEFIVANVQGRSFIIDLTIRQFFDSNLRLRTEEAQVFDLLLRDGFVELTDHSLMIYRRLLQSYFKYKNEEMNYLYNFLNGWELLLEKLSPVSLEDLQISTSEADFEENELKRILVFP